MLNIGSLILGVCAWMLAGVAIATRKPAATAASFSACGVSLLLELFEINRRVLLSDFAAIEDTIRAVLIAAVVLVVVTIVLNTIALRRTK